MTFMKNKPLGQILLDQNKISQDHLDKAIKYKAEHNIYLGKAIITLGFLTEKELAQTLSEQLNIPYMELGSYEIQNESLKVIGEPFAREHLVIPLFILGNEVTIALADPLNIVLIDELNTNRFGYKMNMVLATETDILNTIDLYYGAEKYVQTAQRDVKENIAVVSKQLNEDTEAVEITNLLLDEAVKIGASDIHIEPREDDVRIRFRVDGVLQQYYTIPKLTMDALISRLKIMSEMDIAESRKPQDGRFQYRSGSRKVDIRSSTFPTPNGEKIVMRLLDEKRRKIELNALGFTSELLEHWLKVVHHPNGIILVSGPTGSGKTTTLYSTLNQINSMAVNIMTIEDPIEYMLNNINQSQVNRKAGVTFSSALRTMLRQDPDIILVGEMRDKETIELAIRAALTGHLVFSTIHTNNSAASFTRLLDVGIDPYLITSTVRGILAQRLIRLLCPKCKIPVDMTDQIRNKLEITDYDGQYYKASGCVHCRHSGYSGRSAIFELLEPNEEIFQMILERRNADDIEKRAVGSGMVGLQSSALHLFKEGKTSIEEYLRVIKG